MALRVITSSNIQQWLRRFENKTNTFKTNIADEPQKQAMVGVELSRALVPRDTGTLHNAIAWKTIMKGKTGGTAMIWVRPLQNPEWHGKYSNAARYAAIHHNLGGKTNRAVVPIIRGGVLVGYRHTNNGDPKWLFTVREELKRRYGAAIRGHIQKFI